MVHVTFHYFFMFSRVSKKPPKKGGNLKPNLYQRHHTHCSRTAAISSRSSRLHRATRRVTGVSRSNVPGAPRFRNGEPRRRPGEIVGEFSGFPKKKMLMLDVRVETLTFSLFWGDTIEKSFLISCLSELMSRCPLNLFWNVPKRKMGENKKLCQNLGVLMTREAGAIYTDDPEFFGNPSHPGCHLPGHEDLSRTTPEITKNYRKV